MPKRTVSDEAVKKATGKAWREWFSILDRAGARAQLGSRLRAVRVSRCVGDRVAAAGRGVVLAVQRRACHVAVDGGPLLILSKPGVPLAPNALTVDVEAHVTLEDRGFRVGQVVALGASPPVDREADWLVTLEPATIWEPRPRVHTLGSRDLVDRARTTRATVVADGAGETLLPLLWPSGADTLGFQPGIAGAAGPPAGLLCDAAIRCDEASLTRASRGLAGLGPGLTPSGDDLLAGFVAAWTLIGESLGQDGTACERVTAAVVAGAERGASPLGRVWLAHACRGELLEPMTRYVAALLADDPGDLGAAVRGALAVGASSGTDWMVGFLLAAATMLDTTTSRRPW